MRHIYLLVLLTACDFSFFDDETDVSTLGAVRDASDLAAMQLDVDGVDFIIGGHDKDEVMVLLHADGDEEDANRVLDLELSRDGDVGFLRVRAREDLRRGNVELLVPRHVHLFGELGDGDTVIGGVASLDLHSGDGDMAIGHVDGEISLMMDEGDVLLESVNHVFLAVDDGDIAIHDVAGDAVVHNKDGDIIISNIAGSLDLVDASGDMMVDRIDGDVDIDDEDGDMLIHDIGGMLTIYDGEGDIVIGNAPDHDIVEDSSGDVLIGRR